MDTKLVNSAVLILLGSASCTAQSPSIFPSGVVPVYSTGSNIQAGEWLSVFGTNLAKEPTVWNGDFPTQLGGTSVMINGKAAYLWYVSPGQINLQAPDDMASGTVPVVITTANGSVTSTVTLGQYAPSFSLLDQKHVTGIILRSDRSGAYGGGSYDILGPTGSSIGYPTVAAKPGDNIVLFGVGFGPTSPPVPAGQIFSGAARTTNVVQLLINGISVSLTFAGLSSAGFYQLNFTVPGGLGTGELSLQAMAGGMSTQSGGVISLQDAAATSQIQTLVLSSSTVVGGGPVTGTIVLSAPAPIAGASVSISSSSQVVSVPDTITIPARATSGNFTVQTAAVSSNQVSTLTASFGGASRQVSLSVTPFVGPPFSLLVASAVSLKTGVYPEEIIAIKLLPDPGKSTFTGTVGTLTFANGVATDSGTSFSFPDLVGYNKLDLASIYILVSSASLSLSLSPDKVLNSSGTLNGTLSVTGNPDGRGNSITLKGTLSGQYAEVP